MRNGHITFKVLSIFCRGWLEREYQHELKAGTIWYLVAISWWRIWKEYVSYQVGSLTNYIVYILLIV